MRIVHFSDLHLTADPRTPDWKSLLGKRALGWAKLRFGEGYAHVQDAAEVVKAFVADLAEVAPDFTIFTGNATGLSLPAEWEQAGQLLRPLLARQEVLGIPGADDVVSGRDRRDPPFGRALGRWERSELSECADPAAHPYPLVRFLGERIAIIAVQGARPGAVGELGPGQRGALRKALFHRLVTPCFKILVVHHAPRDRDGAPLPRGRALRDADALLDVAAEGQVSLLLCGQEREPFVLRKGSSTPVPILCAGSLTDQRHARGYSVIEVDGAKVALTRRRYNPATKVFERARDKQIDLVSPFA